MIKKIYKITGMDCEACAKMIELDLEDMGISAKCSYPKETLEVEANGNFSEDKMKEIIENGGYKIQQV